MTAVVPTRVRPRIDIATMERLTELADYIVPFTIRVVADLGIADELVDGARHSDDLAAATGAHGPTLARALRALAARGIFAETDPGVFELTRLAQPLRSDHPMSLRDAFPMLRAEIQAWSAMQHTIDHGKPAFDHVHGISYWDHLAEHAADSQRVDALNTSFSAVHIRTLAGAYPWDEITSLVDLGGGAGAFLAAMLRRFPTLNGVLFDQHHVVDIAGSVFVDQGVDDRVSIVGGSFFDADAIPVAAHCYVLKTVLPGFSDDDVVEILTNIAGAMGPASRLLLLEAVIAEGNAFDVAKLVDVSTMVLTEGRHRSVDEIHDLLRRAGFDPEPVRRTPTLTIVEARPALAAKPARNLNGETQ